MRAHCVVVFVVLIAAALAFVLFIGSAYLRMASPDWQPPPALCSLNMALSGSALVIESKSPAAYEIVLNGSRIWPCPECIERGRLALPIGGRFAEVEVATPLGARKLYVVQTSNGTHTFAWDGRVGKFYCITG